MRTLKISLLLIMATGYFSIQSCKKSADPTPTPTPPKPDTLTTGWTKKQIPGESTTNFSDVFFNSATNGYLLGRNIYHSTNGGITWDSVAVNSSDAFNIFMTADNKAFFTGATNTIRRTADGGLTFTSNSSFANRVFDIYFVDNNNGYGISGSDLYNTTDGGLNWNKLTTTGITTGNYNYRSLYFSTNSSGIVLNENTISRSAGSNLVWQLANVTGYSGNTILQSISAASSVIFVVDAYGILFKSTDGGVNFSYVSRIDSNTSGYYDIHFITPQVGYASCARNIYKTNDGGLSWTKVVSMGETNFTEIHFIDANHGWACGENGTILTYKP